MMKSCNLQAGRCIDCGGKGPTCKAEATLAELRDMVAGLIPPRAVRLTSMQVAALAEPQDRLTSAEISELLPGVEDPTLLGNRIAALTTALGIPPCGACGKRKAWLNQAHAWLRQVPAHLFAAT